MPAAKKPAPKRATITQVRKAAEVPTEEVHVEEWNGTVLVQGLTANQQFAIVAADGDFNTALLQACVLEPELSYEDAAAILAGPYKIANTILTAINRCNGEGVSEETQKTFPAGASA